MTKRPTKPSDESTPGQLPQTTPPDYSQRGHDFTLQCVVELQKSVGAMGAKIDRLVTDVGDHGKEISGISKKINLFLGGAAVLGAVAGVILTIALQLPWSRLFPEQRQTGSAGSAASQPLDASTSAHPSSSAAHPN